jgi:hypothetical protein
MSAAAETAPAIIYVDGAEFIRCEAGDDCRSLFEQTVKEVGGEVALMVWKPRHGIYLRKSLSITSGRAP